MKELNDIMWANVWQEKQWPRFDIKLAKVSEILCFTPLIVIPVELKSTFTPAVSFSVNQMGVTN